MIVVPADEQTALLDVWLRAEQLEVHLYTNDYAPMRLTSLGQLSEAEGWDYAPRLIQPDGWVIAEGMATAPKVEWTFSGMLGRVYGYYIVGARSGRLFWAERFLDGPYVIEANGDGITIDPRFELAG